MEGGGRGSVRAEGLKSHMGTLKDKPSLREYPRGFSAFFYTI